MEKPLRELVIVIKGAGEMSSGIASRLFRANLRRIVMLETAAPMAIRRLVSFSEAVHDGTMTVEGIQAVRVSDKEKTQNAWETGRIAVRVDPKWESLKEFEPEVVIDAILAKQNLGTSIGDAPLVIALGPGFSAGKDCHVVIETKSGHNHGRLLYRGRAEKHTGIPRDVGGATSERILRSPSEGRFSPAKQIGDVVRKGELVATVGGEPVLAEINGVVRGLIRADFFVRPGFKIGDIDPRGQSDCCHTISDKARALGGAVLEAILAQWVHSRSAKNCESFSGVSPQTGCQAPTCPTGCAGGSSDGCPRCLPGDVSTGVSSRLNRIPGGGGWARMKVILTIPPTRPPIYHFTETRKKGLAQSSPFFSKLTITHTCAHLPLGGDSQERGLA